MSRPGGGRDLIDRCPGRDRRVVHEATPTPSEWIEDGERIAGKAEPQAGSTDVLDRKSTTCRSGRDPAGAQSPADVRTREEDSMKYMISWFERPQGSPAEYEEAQKRILEVFGQWEAPEDFKIEVFVVRVGEWGGHMLVECDDPLTVHKFCSMLPAFVMEARPVITVEEAVRGELEVIAWRDALKVG
jgi:uncharacterized protein DUF3303